MNKDIKEAYNNRLKSRIFGLLPEREKENEHGRNWEKYLNNILLELEGFPEEERTINYYIVYYKLSSLRFLRYEYFRSTVLDIMSLLGKKEIK